MIPRRFALPRLASVLLTIACGGTTTTDAGPIGKPETRFDAHAPLDDTAWTRISAPLVVRVLDASGKPASGASVAFRVVSLDSTTFARGVEFLPKFETVGLGAFGEPSLTVRADTNGQARAWVRLGPFVGRIRIHASSAFGTDSIDGTIRPGRTNNFVIRPADTTMAVSSVLLPTIIPRDQTNNRTNATVTLTSNRSGVVEVNNGQLRAAGIGRAQIRIEADGLRDSLNVSVVPPGTLIAFTKTRHSGEKPYFYMFTTDGSFYQRLDVVLSGYNHLAPRWNAALQALVYHETFPLRNDFPLGVIKFEFPSKRQVLLTPGTTILSGSYPVVSRDGAWVYFTAETGYLAESIWRMRPDGSELARIGTLPTQNDVRLQVTIAPDGRRLVFGQGAYSSSNEAMRLMIADVGTGTAVSLAAVGNHPTWSPMGDEIAYFGRGALAVIRPDATGDRIIATGPFDMGDGQIDWSPDGQWLATCIIRSNGDRAVALVERATGTILPLAFTAKDSLCDATWKLQ